MTATEQLPPGAEAPWAEWKCLNRLRTQVGRCKANLKRWGYPDGENGLCECGAEQRMAHLLECPKLDEACGPMDLAAYNATVEKRSRFWSGRAV